MWRQTHPQLSQFEVNVNYLRTWESFSKKRRIQEERREDERKGGVGRGEGGGGKEGKEGKVVRKEEREEENMYSRIAKRTISQKFLLPF